MADLSDETLMAFADGVLDPALHDVVEAAIRDHAEYRTKVEKFKQTLTPIRRAFTEMPLPERHGDVLSRIRHAELRKSDDEAGSCGSHAAWQSNRKVARHGGSRAARFPVAIAASVGLLIGAGLGWLVPSRVGPTLAGQGVIAFGDHGLAAQGSFRQFLETVKSGTPTVAASDGRIWRYKALFTFRSVGGTFCRRYEMINDAEARFAGYACRTGGGQWLVLAQVKSEALDHNGKGFVTSGGQNDTALDAVIDIVRNGDVFEIGLENELLQNAWRTSP